MESLVGQRFGRWKVEKLAGLYQGHWPVYWCKCDCGTFKRVKGYTLKQGSSKSCGCLMNELTSKRSRTHGLTESRTYKSWLSMKWRCTTKNDNYSYYTRKGITYDPRWEAFEAFLADMGERPEGTSIDRIDNSKGYFKENCRWATPTIQNNNSGQVHPITFLGITRSIKGWSDVTGINRLTLQDRLHRGWSIQDSLTKPVRKR